MELLVDGDIVLYQCATVNQEEFVWDEDTTSESLDLENAKLEFDASIASLIDKTKTTQAIICFSDSPCFRYDVLPSYKHNRVDIEKPKLYYDLRDYALSEYTCKVKPKLEADDVLGILATLRPHKYVVASIDKDLMQIPGVHYNWKHNERKVITPAEGDYWFYTQILTGDPTDGYSGCPGIGPKRAERALAKCRTEEEYWTAIVKTYESKGFKEEDALVQARVARILRKDDYDFKKKEVILWDCSMKEKE